MAADSTTRGRGRPRRDRRPPGSSRAELMDAAAELFAELGYEATGVGDITTRAGLSKGTFYFNFSSKEELFLAVLDERIDAPARLVMQHMEEAPGDTPTAPTVSAALAAIVRHQPTALLLLEYGMQAARDERLAERYTGRVAALRRRLAEALRARHAHTGVPLTMDAERLAQAFIALAQGLAGLAVVDPSTVDDALFGDIAALVYDGLAARAGSAESRGP